MNGTRPRAVAPVCVMFSALVLAGCGGTSTGTLSGTVQYKGKAVNTGTVTVFDSEKRAHQGPIEDGKYTVLNVPYGEVSLIVMSPNPAAAEGDRTEGGRDAGRDKRPDAKKAAPAAGWFPIPSRYGDTGKSPLKTTISAKSNDYPITLTD